MNTLQKLLATTAMVALSAAPLAALTLDTNTSLGAYELIYPQVDPADSTGPATGDAANSVAGAGNMGDVQPDPSDATGPATGDGDSTTSTAGSSDDAAVAAESDTNDSTGPATGDDAEAVKIARPAMAPGFQIDAESGFVGNSVVSVDGATVGVVEEVVTQSNSQKLLVILQNGGTTSEKRYTIAIDGGSVPDGTIDLGWTEAELTSAIAGL